MRLRSPLCLLALGLSLCIAPVAFAQDAPVEQVEVDPKWTEAFTEYTEEMASGQKARAADALIALIEDEGRTAYHGDAYGLLSDLLEGLDLRA